MNSHELDTRVQFLRYVETDDGFSVTNEWECHGKPIWAARRDISDRERIASQQIAATITTRFTVRYSCLTEGLTPKDRIQAEGETYDIVGIKRIGRRTGFEITANARADL
jgi:SPP1 family predicted phage head-tail adaptor